MRIRNLYTALGALPNVRPEFTAIDTTMEIPPAPLLHSCVDNRAGYQLLILAMYHFSSLTREEFDEDIRRSLMRRLNAFAVLEINLWALARNASFEEPPPSPSATTSPAGSGAPTSPDTSSASAAAAGSNTGAWRKLATPESGAARPAHAEPKPPGPNTPSSHTDEEPGSSAANTRTARGRSSDATTPTTASSTAHPPSHLPNAEERTPPTR